MKTGAATSEFWLGAGGLAAISQMPTGSHAIAVGIIVAAYALSRALSKTA